MGEGGRGPELWLAILSWAEIHYLPIPPHYITLKTGTDSRYYTVFGVPVALQCMLAAGDGLPARMRIGWNIMDVAYHS